MPGAPANNLALDETGTYRTAPGPLADSDIAWTVETGIPAITASTGGISAADIVQYHHFQYPTSGGPTNSLPDLYGAAGYSSKIPTQILRIQRLTAGQLAQRDSTLHTNLPVATQLYIVEYSGEFSRRVPFGVPALVYPIAFEVFDANNGNLMMWGISPRPLISVTTYPASFAR